MVKTLVTRPSSPAAARAERDLELAVDVGQAGAVGAGQQHRQHAAVFVRRQFLRQPRRQQRGRGRPAAGRRRPAARPAQHRGQCALVAVCQPVRRCGATAAHAAGMRPGGGSAGSRAAIIGASDSATNDDSITAMAMTKPNSVNRRPAVRRQEGDRHEHRHQGGGGGDDGEEHLARAQHGRGARAQALAAAALDVFQHDDGIVHHQAAGQHQRQQGQQVDRKAQQPDRAKRADQGHRNGHRRHQRRPPAAQEHADHGDDDHHRQHQAGEHLADRAADEDGVVGHDSDLQVLAARVDLLHDAAHAFGDGHAVRLRLAHDAQADDGATVQPHIGAGIGRVEVDIGHLGHARRRASRSRSAASARVSTARRWRAPALPAGSISGCRPAHRRARVRSAATTSSTARPSAASRAGSRRTRSTCAAAAEGGDVGHAAHRDQFGFDAFDDGACQLVDRQALLDTASWITGSASASALMMLRFSMPSGRLPSTRATASRTSLAASTRFDVGAELDDHPQIRPLRWPSAPLYTPGTRAAAPSISRVTSASSVSGAAPG